MRWAQAGQGRYRTGSRATADGSDGNGSAPSRAPWRSRLVPNCSNTARSSQRPPQAWQAWTCTSPILDWARGFVQAGQGAPSGAAIARAAMAAPQPGQWLAVRGTRAKQAGQATVASWAW